jgi:hypothetical protein
VYIQFKEGNTILSDCNWDQANYKATQVKEISIGRDEVIVGACVTTDGNNGACTISFSVLDYYALGWNK